MNIENPTQNKDKDEKSYIEQVWREAHEIMTERDGKMIGRTLSEERQNEFDGLTWQLKSKIERLKQLGVRDTDPGMQQLLDSLKYPKPQG